MIRLLVVIILLAASTLDAQQRTVKWTGWVSDKQCARIRSDELPRPNGTACVKKCLDDGATAVFITEQARAIYEVRGFPSAPLV